MYTGVTVSTALAPDGEPLLARIVLVTVGDGWSCLKGVDP